jgi:hypothetical protein
MNQEHSEDSLLELILFSFFIKCSEQEKRTELEKNTEFQISTLGTITMTIGEIIDYIHNTRIIQYSKKKLSEDEVSEIIKDNPTFFETFKKTEMGSVINYKLTDYGSKYVYETLSVY